MLEKQKNGIKKNIEKGRKWIGNHKGPIMFGLGAATMVGVRMVLDKVNEPKTAAICFGREETMNNAIIGQVWYKNRFGKEKHFVNVNYGNGDGALKHICDNLNETMYPGD